MVRGARDRSGAPFGVLVLHGFTGSPASVLPVAEGLAAAGFTVDVPLLPGHGTSTDDLDDTTFDDWATTAEARYDDLRTRCRAVGVFGISMGGSLTCRLAALHPEIVGAVLVNPFVEPVSPIFKTLLSDAIAAGESRIPSIGSDIARLDHPEPGGYSETPIRPLLSLVDGVDELASLLGQIKSPLLLFTSRNDHVVPTSTGAYLEANLTCPLERVMLERSFHVATLDYDGDEIVRRSVEFMERLAS